MESAGSDADDADATTLHSTRHIEPIHTPPTPSTPSTPSPTTNPTTATATPPRSPAWPRCITLHPTLPSICPPSSWSPEPRYNLPPYQSDDRSGRVTIMLDRNVDGGSIERELVFQGRSKGGERTVVVTTRGEVVSCRADGGSDVADMRVREYGGEVGGGGEDVGEDGRGLVRQTIRMAKEEGLKAMWWNEGMVLEQRGMEDPDWAEVNEEDDD